MEKLLQDIDSDVSSICSSRSSSTFAGIGSLSGKAIMSIGQIVLRSFERRSARKRLRIIGEHIGGGEMFVPADMYDDLLEFQRVGLYPEEIRVRAWDLLLVLMERRRTERMVDEILKWPSIEIRLILRQLSVFKLSGWCIHPAKYTARLDPKSPAACVQTTYRESDLVHSYRSIFGAVVKRHPHILHDLFDINQFLLLEMNTAQFNIDMDSVEYKSTRGHEPLALFFDYLVGQGTPLDKEKWPLPFHADYVVEFLRDADLDDMHQVVDYIVGNLQSFAISEPPTLRNIDLMVVSTSPAAIHPAVLYLWFVLHLVSRSRNATMMVMKAGLFNVLRSVWREDFRGVSDNVLESETARRDMRLLACMILGVLSSRAVFAPTLARFLRVQHAEFFLQIFSDFIGNYRKIDAFRRPFLNTESPDDRSAFYTELLGYHSALDPRNRDESLRNCILTGVNAESKNVVVDCIMRMSEDRAHSVLRLLVALRLTASFHVLPPLNDVEETDESQPFAPSSYPHYITVLRSIVEDIRRQKPLLVHRSISVEESAILQTDATSDSVMVLQDKDGLSIFFEQLSSSSKFELHGPSELQSYAEGFIRHLQSAPPEQVHAVVQHMMAYMLPFATTVLSKQHALAVIYSHPSLRSHIHPILPFVIFAIHLAYSSPQASQLFIEAGLPQLLLHKLLYTQPDAPQIDLARLRIRFLLLFGALSTHHRGFLISSLRDTAFEDFVLPLLSQMMSVQLCIRYSVQCWADLAPHIWSIVPQSMVCAYPPLEPIPGGPLLSDPPWRHLISRFSDINMSSQHQARVAEEILFFASSVCEDDWDFLAAILYSTPPGMYGMYGYIIREYLGCSAQPGSQHSDRIVQYSTQTETYLQNLLRTSAACGFAVVHPVDRFVMLTAKATRANRASVQCISMDDMLALLQAVRDGAYNVGITPSQQQLSQRQRECQWMKVQITYVQTSED